jgi:hypothetical protein
MIFFKFNFQFSIYSDFMRLTRGLIYVTSTKDMSTKTIVIRLRIMFLAHKGTYFVHKSDEEMFLFIYFFFKKNCWTNQICVRSVSTLCARNITLRLICVQKHCDIF